MKAFVIMSFNEKYDNVFERSIRPAFEECGYDCYRADRNLGTENIPHRVIRDIIDADIVLADLSGNRPNVFYELGVSHCVDNKTLTIIADDEDIPFDIAAYRLIKYNNSSSGLELLKYRLKEEIGNFDRNKMVNLVQDAGRDYFDLRKKIEAKLKKLNEEIKRAKAFSDFFEDHFPEQDNLPVVRRITDHIDALRERYPGRAILVSICGSGASGKSSFSRLLKENIREALGIPVSILATDSYMLSRADRIEKDLLGFDPRANDLEQFSRDVRDLLENKEIKISPYNHETGEHEKEITVKPGEVIILEGIYSFYPELNNLCRELNAKQLKYFIHADKYKAKELKFISDIKNRGHNIHKALQHAVPEYSAYETYILPHIKLADYIIRVEGYWKFKLPEKQDVDSLYQK